MVLKSVLISFNLDANLNELIERGITNVDFRDDNLFNDWKDNTKPISYKIK